MNFSNLLHWAIIFFVVALVAALLGFGGVAGTAMEGARPVLGRYRAGSRGVCRQLGSQVIGLWPRINISRLGSGLGPLTTA